MKGLSVFLSRLDNCRQIREGEWIARCPAHDDRSPSLSVSEKPHKINGELIPLINCHAGCGALEVITAVGMDWGDLLPDTNHHYPARRHKAPRETVDSLVVEIAEQDRRNGKRLSKADIERYREAKKRLKNSPVNPVLTEIAAEAWNDKKQAAMEKTVLEKLENGEELTPGEATWGRWQLNHKGGAA